jgi:hypothetical protein
MWKLRPPWERKRKRWRRIYLDLLARYQGAARDGSLKEGAGGAVGE